MLVVKVAQDLFYYIFHREQARRAAVFVHNESGGDLLLVHHHEDFRYREVFGHDDEFTHDAVKFALFVTQIDLQDISDVDHTQYRVLAAVDVGVARVFGVKDHFDVFFVAFLLVYADHIAARRHYLFCHRVGEINRIFDDLGLKAIENAAF